MLLEPEPDAPERLDLGWGPQIIASPRRQLGTGFWVAAGLATIIAAWLVLSLVSFVLALFAQSWTVAAIAVAAIAIGVLMIGYGATLEFRAYRSLGTVEQLRTDLASAETTLAAARKHGQAWLHQVRTNIPDPVTVARMLEGATSVIEIRAILRSQIADHLQQAARTFGKRAAVEGATLVAICPHPAWDGLMAAGRGVFVIRQVAALYGLRPGLVGTLGLVRRVAWTAAASTGLTLVSQGLADHVLTTMPVIKHVSGALPGTGVVAARLYRLAVITAEACSPVSE